MHPHLLHGVCKLASPEERMLAVTRWFLSGWHYRTLGVKKPFNPIIGETFACILKDDDGSTTQYFAEQVLHRPPISAVFFENKEHCYRANAHIWTKGTFVFPQSSKSALDGGCSASTFPPPCACPAAQSALSAALQALHPPHSPSHPPTRPLLFAQSSR